MVGLPYEVSPLFLCPSLYIFFYPSLLSLPLSLLFIHRSLSFNFYVLQHMFIKFLNIVKSVNFEWVLKISYLRKMLYFSQKKVVIMFGQ